MELPCGTCRYILRGLEAAGRCPECGRPISETLLDELARRMNLDDTAVRAMSTDYLRRIARGGAYLTAAAMLTVLVGFAPRSWFDFRSIPRVVIFCVTCTLCGLSLMGLWNIGVRDSGRPWRSDDSYGVLLRASVIGALGYLLLTPLVNDHQHPIAMTNWTRLEYVVEDLLVWVVPICGGLMFVRLRHVAKQLQSPLLATTAGFVACIGSALLGASVSEGLFRYRYVFNSFELLAGFPVLPSGPLYLLYTVADGRFWPASEFQYLPVTLIAVLCIVSIALVGLVTRRALRTLKTVSRAAGGIAQRTETSLRR